MQYILTKEEYENLVPKKKADRLEETIDKLNDLVLEYSKYPCIHKHGGCGLGYCDDCPITFSCKEDKYYSK